MAVDLKCKRERAYLDNRVSSSAVMQVVEKSLGAGISYRCGRLTKRIGGGRSCRRGVEHGHVLARAGRVAVGNHQC